MIFSWILPRKHSIVLALIWLLLRFISSDIAMADSYYPNSGVDVTDDARTVEKGRYQLLLNYEWDEFDGDGPDPAGIAGNSAGLAALSLKYGITDRLDVGIQVPYMFTSGGDVTISGPADFELGFKYLLTPLREKHLWVSAIVSAKAATAPADNGQGNGVTDYAAHLAMTYRSGKWTDSINFGYNFWGDIPGTPRSPVPFYRGEITYQCTPSFSLSGEIYGQQSPNLDYSGSPLQATLKTTLQLSKNLALDLGIAKGLNGDAPARRYLVSLTCDL